jgi:hypothetical protein
VSEQPPEQAGPAGHRLIAGRYRLRRVLGRGAMGVVWLGYDEVLHRLVAVKEVQLPVGMPEAEANEVRERTLREARAIAALTHPNVVAVYDVAKEGVEPFVVMEWLRGRSLAQVAGRSGTLNTEQAAVVADAIAAGLDMAHRRGITHRDVKPGNVLVGEDGQVKLTDFGIARNVSEVTLTSRGLILGTPAFMAPEVAAGEPVTTAADLWGFGATLFAVLEGRPPYEGDDPVALVSEVVHGEIPRVADDSPLADVITGLMARDPAARMSVVEVRRRIRPLLPEPGSVVFPPDEAEEAAGPADDKRTAELGRDRKPKAEPADSRPELDAPPPLAAEPGPVPPLPADPGPLPLLAAEPGPLPWERPPPPTAAPVGRPRVRARRRPAVTAVLLAVAVVLFLVAATAGFAATRRLAGREVLPPPASTSTPTTTTPSRAPALDVTLVRTTAAAPVMPATSGGDFTLEVPADWNEFVEQRQPQEQLPPSTAVRWVKPDGTAELAVERFTDYLPQSPKQYTTELQTNGGAGRLFQAGSIYLWRSSVTQRSTYIGFVTDQGGSDLWVVTMTVPTYVEEGNSVTVDLFNKIMPTLRVSG